MVALRRWWVDRYMRAQARGDEGPESRMRRACALTHLKQADSRPGQRGPKSATLCHSMGML